MCQKKIVFPKDPALARSCPGTGKCLCLLGICRNRRDLAGCEELSRGSWGTGEKLECEPVGGVKEVISQHCSPFPWHGATVLGGT